VLKNPLNRSKAITLTLDEWQEVAQTALDIVKRFP
jgi:hypothetical protein